MVVGRESWGTLVAIFVPLAGTTGMRKTLLDASGRGAGHSEIDGLSEGELQALLNRSEPAGPTSGDP